MSQRPDYAREVRNALTDPTKLAEGLGLAKGWKRQHKGVIVCCPVHGERNASCSVSLGRDGTIRVRCFACDFTGDALTLIGVVYGLRLNDRDGFRETLAEGARLAGHLSLEAEIRDGQARPDRKPVPRPAPGEETVYPETSEVMDLWARAKRPDADTAASGYLVRRRLDPVVVSERGLARVLVPPLPPWAVYGGRSWDETGHRLACLTFDADGVIRGVRVTQILNTEQPKRLPPKGKKAGELVLTNRAAWRMLKGSAPREIVIVEGEPDFWTHAVVQDERVAVLGVTSGSWTDRFAAALPRGAQVTIRTHGDEQGERYAATIAESIGERCHVWRAA